ncbi:MerR family DNA-binding protein [Sphingomonas sp.]|uniref:MerR family DNA-binding protein n=1 Tax=Sphingomonas sp. TaxID=28214 RepID=UPI002DD633FC|nr:MerR family DNA-binding protein [Sphingomonas sp.]
MVRSQALTISRLAESAGVGVETVRFYQRRGLMAVPPRDGVRRYGTDDVARLRFIRQAQAAGFTLAEIGTLLALNASEDRATVRAMARERIATLDAQIAELSAARDALDRLARDCASAVSGPCPILEAFERR